MAPHLHTINAVECRLGYVETDRVLPLSRAAQPAKPLGWDAEGAVELAGQILECDQARQLDHGVVIEMALEPVHELIADR